MHDSPRNISHNPSKLQSKFRSFCGNYVIEGGKLVTRNMTKRDKILVLKGQYILPTDCDFYGIGKRRLGRKRLVHRSAHMPMTFVPST